MKKFQIIPSIAEYVDFAAFAAEEKIGPDDLVLTNEYIYNPVISDLNLGCQTCFQEQYGMGEPTDIMVDAILDALRDKEYKRVIAVGGGTIIDIAKVLTVAGKKDTVDSLYDNMANLKKEYPLIIVPTTCGTGSEVTNIAIINRTRMGTKLGLVNPAMFADEAVLITGMLKTLPYGVFATSSIDAMVHAIESYLSPNACAISEMFSKAALELILPCWQKAVAAGGNDAWKEDADKFLRASNYAGIAFGHAGCAAVHAMSYPLSGAHHVPHGKANQMMFVDVMKKYKEKQPVGKLQCLEEMLAGIMGGEAATALDALYDLLEKVLKRDRLSEVGTTEDEIEIFTKSCIETQQRLLGNNYTELTYDDMMAIYKAAF